MFRTSPRLLGGLLTTSAIVSIALAWAGWRLFEQQRDLDRSLANDRVEAAAGAMAAGIRERLAELGDQLGSRLTASPSALPALPAPPALPASPIQAGPVIFVQRATGIDVQPIGALPFVPVLPSPLPASPLFDEGEAAEFRTGELDKATALYASLAKHADPFIRTGALFRLGRVLVRGGQLHEAVEAYEQLGALGHLRTDTLGLPASLMSLAGQRHAYQKARDGANEQRLAEEIRRRLDGGEWQLTRGFAEFYRDEVSDAPRPDSWQLASALHDAWSAGEKARDPRGYLVVTPADRSTLVVWRTDGVNLAMAAAWLEEFVASAGDSHATWQLADAEDRPFAGTRTAPPATAVTRVIGAAGGPAWTLRVWPSAEPAGVGGRGPVLVAALLAMLAFVWGATYFMARAIRREAEAAHLQADFVAAVSHEFRSPLSTMRQMSEMLDTDRVPAESRRRQYYGVLMAETGRLQRLVETLLNFGRLEAGGKPYRFGDLEISALVGAIISEMRNEPGLAGRSIVMTAPDSPHFVHADQDAIRLAVRNLIDNAMKYSPAESEVRVTVTCDGSRIAIAVSDEGPGIASNEQRTIFKKFVRGRAARDGRVPGTGVGLAIVQRIVAAHQGSIELASEPGRGSTFTILLPLDASGLRAINVRRPDLQVGQGG